MVIMASSIAVGRVRTTTTTMVESRKMAGGYTTNNRLTETCSLGLKCTFFISTDTCQIKLSAEQRHVTISRAQVYSSSRSRVLLKLTADQVLVFDWIAGSCRVNLLETESGCSEAC